MIKKLLKHISFRWNLNPYSALRSRYRFGNSEGKLPLCWPMRGRVLIVTYVSAPHGEQAEGQRPASGREETGEVVSEGKMGAHHLHAEQNTYRRGGGKGRKTGG